MNQTYTSVTTEKSIASELVRALVESGEKPADFFKRKEVGSQKGMLTIGTVSRGTMVERHLIRRFMAALEEVDRSAYKQLRNDPDLAAFWEALDNNRDEDTPELREEGSNLLEHLFDVLNKFCPPYTYFGAHEGDGSDYGCWVDRERLDAGLENGDVVRVAFDSPEARDLGVEMVPEVAHQPGVTHILVGDNALYDAKTGKLVWIDV